MTAAGDVPVEPLVGEAVREPPLTLEPEPEALFCRDRRPLVAALVGGADLVAGATRPARRFLKRSPNSSMLSVRSQPAVTLFSMAAQTSLLQERVSPHLFM